MNDEWCCCCFLQQFYENPTQNTRHLFTVNDMHRKFKSSQKRACCSKFPLQMVDNGPKHIAHKLNHSPNALEIQSVYLCREFDMNNNARSELAFPHVPNDSEWWFRCLGIIKVATNASFYRVDLGLELAIGVSLRICVWTLKLHCPFATYIYIRAWTKYSNREICWPIVCSFYQIIIELEFSPELCTQTSQ